MRKQQGFTLVEIAIVLVIIGLLLGGILRGQELIQGARVRNLIDQQSGLRAAYFAFQDRYRSLPGDLTAQQVQLIGRGTVVASNGPGNGVIAANDSPIAFQNMALTGFISCSVCTATAGAASTAANSPINVYGGVLQFVTDGEYAIGAAISTATAPQTNFKTGNLIPSNVMGEMDLKADDGSPSLGNLRLSQWQAAGGPATPPTVGTCATGMAPAPVISVWNNGQAAAPGGPIGTNCGGANLL